MNSFGYEYFESATGPHVSASASTGPLVLGMGSGEESMDDAGGSDKRGNYSDGVMWLGSQASSALGHLMTGGTKGSEEGTTSSLGIAGGTSFSPGLVIHSFLYLLVVLWTNTIWPHRPLKLVLCLFEHAFLLRRTIHIQCHPIKYHHHPRSGPRTFSASEHLFFRIVVHCPTYIPPGLRSLSSDRQAGDVSGRREPQAKVIYTQTEIDTSIPDELCEPPESG